MKSEIVDITRAWLDGKDIDIFDENTGWTAMPSVKDIGFTPFSDKFLYRIRPKVVVQERYVYFTKGSEAHPYYLCAASVDDDTNKPNVRFTMDANTEKLINVEFI